MTAAEAWPGAPGEADAEAAAREALRREEQRVALVAALWKWAAWARPGALGGVPEGWSEEERPA